MMKEIPFPSQTKPCFPYPGGKTRLLKHILPRIPEHSTYIEPFAGGLAVLLSKPRVKVEVINDLNAELVTFYRYVRLHSEALKIELAGRLQSRQEFVDMRTSHPLTDLQRAVRWYLLKVCSFGGYSDAWGRSKTGFHGFDEDRHLALIDAVSKRLNRVFIESKDWEEVVAFYDNPTAFTYFDPPYVVGDPGAAYDAFTAEEMQRVRTRTDQMKGQWMLSCDDSPACREIFSDHTFVQLPIKYASSGAAGQAKPTSWELLILSPGLAEKKRAA